MQPKELLKRALSNYRGDNLERARHAFLGLTPAQMQEQHGQSGQTRAEILAEYECHVADCVRAAKWLDEQGA